MDVSQLKKVAYTVITDGYDHLFPPTAPQPGWDLICFTDDPTLESDVFAVRPLPQLPELEGLKDDPVRTARMVKILAHRFLQGYDYSVYFDANRVIDDDLSAYVQRYGAPDLLCLQGVHADGYAAAEVLLTDRGFDDFEVAPIPPLPENERDKLRHQMTRWKETGLKELGGCPGTSVLGRFHRDDAVQATMEFWAKEVLEGCRADEVALPYACHVGRLAWIESFSQYPAPGDTVSPAEELAVMVPHARWLACGQKLPKERVYPANPPPPGGPYGGWPFLLTIGVPVSNQIGTIRRCLEGIKPLLDGLDAELVVIDTGSTDGTVGVCREFGARVIDFPWINDMSAARNQGIQAGLGLWYMSIDDDEWFEDVTPIIAFFNSGLYKKVDLASYNQRNYTTDGITFSDFPTTRMGRRDAGLHFEGRIHDALTLFGPASLKSRAIEAHANHLGFSFERDSDLAVKSIRNTRVLRLDVAQFPTDLRFSYQMVNEMMLTHNPQMAYRFAYLALSQHRAAGSGNNRSIPAIVAMAMHAMARSGIHRQCLRFAEKFMHYNENSLYTQCALAFIMAQAHMGCVHPVDAYIWCDCYIEAYSRFNKLPLAKQAMQRGTFLSDAVNENALGNVLSRKWQLCVLMGRHSDAVQLMCNEPLLRLFQEKKSYQEAVYANLLLAKRWSLAGALFKAFLAADETLSAQMLLAKVNHYAAPRDFDMLRRHFGPEVFQQWPGYENLLVLREAAPNDDRLEAHYSAAISLVNSFELDARREMVLSLLEEVLRLGLDDGPVMALMDRETTDYLIGKTHRPGLQALPLAKALDAWQPTITENDPPQARYLALRHGESTLVNAKRGRGQERYRGIFENYIHQRLAWESQFYLPNALTGYGSPWVEPGLQAVCAARQALEAQQANDALAALRALKVTLLKAPDMKEAVELVKEEVTEWFETESKRVTAAQSEFSLLLAGIKPKLEALIEAGMLSEVAALIAQLEQLAPDDADLIALKRKAGLLPPS